MPGNDADDLVKAPRLTRFREPLSSRARKPQVSRKLLIRHCALIVEWNVFHE
jgi:hypothetical protein